MSADATPCTFTSITPAWNNENLGRLSCKIMSPLVFAHVRAAYPGMPVSEQNCHPFQWGSYMFMHNGVIGGFMKIRRALLSSLSDAAYNAVQSFHSDSAVAFAIFLHHLPSLTDALQPAQLLAAIEATVATITSLQAEQSITDVSLLNFVMADATAPGTLITMAPGNYSQQHRGPYHHNKTSTNNRNRLRTKSQQHRGPNHTVGAHPGATSSCMSRTATAAIPYKLSDLTPVTQS